MTDQIFEYAKKQGWNVGFVIVILWMNARLNEMEERLYHCYETMQLSEITHSNESHNYRLKQLAILPIKREDEKRIKRIIV
tara:strand:- start:12160 stop:12402 length:243 start_codon:yes stop_codon:yes gene_type:complete